MTSLPRIPVPPSSQMKATWGFQLQDGVRAANYSSSVVIRYFRGQQENIKIAGPGEKPSVPLSQRSRQDQSLAATSSSILVEKVLSGPPPAPDNETAWDRDVRLIRENEYWEGRVVSIADDLQERYRDRFKDVGVHQKIAVLKMLEYFGWNRDRSLDLLKVLEKTPNHLVINMVELLQTFEATPRYLDTGIDLFCALNDRHFMDLVGNFSIQQVKRLRSPFQALSCALLCPILRSFFLLFAPSMTALRWTFWATSPSNR